MASLFGRGFNPLHLHKMTVPFKGAPFFCIGVFSEGGEKVNS